MREPRGRFPTVVVDHAVHLCLSYGLSFRETAELMRERGVKVTHETVRAWIMRRRASDDAGESLAGLVWSDWKLEHEAVRLAAIAGHLWVAKTRDGRVLECCVQIRRNQPAARRELRRLIDQQRDMARSRGLADQ